MGCYRIDLGDIMKEKNQTKEKWIRMNNIMNKVLKILGIIGIVLVAISLIVAFFGILMRTSYVNLFYAGISLLIFVVPAYFAAFLMVFAIAVIIEGKSKK